MKIIDDDLLNNFIDKDLSIEEMQFLKHEIDKNDELKKRYENLLLVHSSLVNSEANSTSENFSKILMQKISKSESRAVQQKRFLFFILSIFGALTFGIVSYLFYQLLSSLTFSDSSKVISDYSRNFGEYFSALFGKKNLSIFGSILSFVMLVGGYFLFEYQKNIKKNLSL